MGKGADAAGLPAHTEHPVRGHICTIQAERSRAPFSDTQRTETTTATGPDPDVDPDSLFDGESLLVEAFDAESESVTTGNLSSLSEKADGSGEVELLTPGSGSCWDGASWTPDGRRLVYVRADATNDLHWIDVDGGEESNVFVATDAEETRPAVAPDGRWVAYQSDESGEREVYVRPFPGPGGKWQISRGGGRYPVWSRDGKWLYFHDRAVIKRVSVSAAESAFRAGRPEEVVDLGKRIVGTWDVAADGTLHVPTATLDQAGEDARAVVGMIFHWPVELERLVPE